jgi:hypothetical protein
MNTTDWLINIALVALVVLQLRWHKVDRRFILRPLVLVGIAAASYLKTVPTGGNDLVLIAALMAVGVTFGGLSALATSVRAESGAAWVRSRPLAIGLWIAGIGSRIAFVLYAEHGGESSIEHFSAQHHITSIDAWTAALVLMALAEVLTRVGLLAYRGHRAVLAARTTEQPQRLHAVAA